MNLNIPSVLQCLDLCQAIDVLALTEYQLFRFRNFCHVLNHDVLALENLRSVSGLICLNHLSGCSELIAGGDARLTRVACACRPSTEVTSRCNFGRLCGVLTVDGRTLVRTGD
ncbi:hypothetical protein V4R08_15670 (plasmid) [Nitrobacter sp. NHB1]|uniref:hypothetical protein n=1 Tax=Nitrobacter sp. NHB1 TaxID=3119830 RepID=UPI002FFE31B6